MKPFGGFGEVWYKWRKICKQNQIGSAAPNAAARQERRYAHIRCWRIFPCSAQSADIPVWSVSRTVKSKILNCQTLRRSADRGIGSHCVYLCSRHSGGTHELHPYHKRKPWQKKNSNILWTLVRKWKLRSNIMMMMCVMPMNYITCSCEDSQMDMSSVRETGLPAHNDQNACL